MAKLYADVYAEINAELISESIQAVENTGVVVRAFRDRIPNGKEDAVIQEMWNSRFYIDNPQADRKGSSDPSYRLTGRWRVVSIRKSAPGENPAIIEELHRGYVQAPGTAEDPSKDENDWSHVDSQARIIKTIEFDDANRQKAGENRYYTMVIPGVATATVKEFCSALAGRETLENPTFGLQTVVEGTWSIRGVRNEDQGDGSSLVVASLANAGGFSPGEIVFNDNWNETTFQNYYKNLPDYQSDPFPPVNILAVNDPNDATRQLSWATIYNISNAGIEPSTGLWTVTISKRTAKPYVRIWELPTGNDNISEYEVEFYNQTPEWVTYMFAYYQGKKMKVSKSGRLNEFQLISGTIWAITPSVSTTMGYHVENLAHMEVHKVEREHGIFYYATYTVYDLDKNVGIAAHLAAMVSGGVSDLGPGGYFRPQGADWYEMKQVMFVFELVYDATDKLTGSSIEDFSWPSTWSLVYANAAAQHRERPTLPNPITAYVAP